MSCHGKEPHRLRGIEESLKRELWRLRHSPIGLQAAVMVPLSLLLFFWLLLHSLTLRELPVVLCDEDQSPLSRRLASMADAAPGVWIVERTPSPAKAEALLLEGQVWGRIHIPRGFERAIYASQPAVVRTTLSGTNLSADGVLTRDLQLTASTFSGGIALQRFELLGLDKEEALARVQPISLIDQPLFNPTLNYAHYLGPGLMAMMLLMSVLTTTLWAVGGELRHGTAATWLFTARRSLSSALIGKLLPYTGLHLLLAQFMLLLLIGGFHLPVRGSLLLLEAGTLLLILAYQAIALAVVAATGNLRLSLSLGGGYGVAAFSFSGLTFPTMAMFPLVRIVSRLFPFTPYMELMIDQTLRGAPALYAATPLLEMGLFLLLPLPLMGRLRRHLTNPITWYRL